MKERKGVHLQVEICVERIENRKKKINKVGQEEDRNRLHVLFALAFHKICRKPARSNQDGFDRAKELIVSKGDGIDKLSQKML